MNTLLISMLIRSCKNHVLFALTNKKCFIYDELISLNIKLAIFHITYLVQEKKIASISICLGFPGYEYKCLGNNYHLKEVQLN